MLTPPRGVLRSGSAAAVLDQKLHRAHGSSSSELAAQVARAQADLVWAVDHQLSRVVHELSASTKRGPAPVKPPRYSPPRRVDLATSVFFASTTRAEALDALLAEKGSLVAEAERAQREGHYSEAGSTYARVAELQVYLDEVARRTTQSSARAAARSVATEAMARAKGAAVERANDLSAQVRFFFYRYILCESCSPTCSPFICFN